MKQSGYATYVGQIGSRGGYGLLNVHNGGTYIEQSIIYRMTDGGHLLSRLFTETGVWSGWLKLSNPTKNSLVKKL